MYYFSDFEVFVLNILDKINCSNDIKNLNDYELEQLCTELREIITNTVSKTGGHLASNLGSVELTVAMHRVYDSAVDRIIFDVGHQCYSHKIITGRKDQFNTLRQFDGISGFPKPYEMQDDAFIAGHASDSIAVALGMARARTILRDTYDVVAVIGDGALTGGLAYEGLENAGVSGEPMVIILNDNGMSINGNVGAMERVLSKIRVRPEYIEFKRYYRSTIGRCKKLYNFNHELKEQVKRRLLPSTMFDDFGLYYLGPIDGHDIKQLETSMQWAKQLRMPVLLHVITKKGKGCSYAEEQPNIYHGVGSFNPTTGELPACAPSYSTVVGETLCDIAFKNKDVVAITAAMADGTGLDSFALKFPRRFFDVGIAEGGAVTMAAGMAKQGLKPVFCVYSSFFQRSYDMLIHDVSLQNLHVVFCIDRAGLVGSDGETHHGLFDISFLRSVPNIKILCPCNFHQLREMLIEAVLYMDGPVAVRYPRGGEPADVLDLEPSNKISAKSRVTLASYGNMYWQIRKAADLLMCKGISCDIINFESIQPLDLTELEHSVSNTGNLIVVEECCNNGCIGEAILSAFSDLSIHSQLINLGDGVVVHGKVDELMKKYRIDSESIALAAEKMVVNNG